MEQLLCAGMQEQWLLQIQYLGYFIEISETCEFQKRDIIFCIYILYHIMIFYDLFS